MLARFRLAPVLAVVLALVATSAFAVTEAEVHSRATQLDADYSALLSAVEQATPPQYATLEAAFEALEVDRLDLKADRAMLGGCSCTQIDALIDHIDAMAAEIEDVIDGWQA